MTAVKTFLSCICELTIPIKSDYVFATLSRGEKRKELTKLLTKKSSKKVVLYLFCYCHYFKVHTKFKQPGFLC